MLAHPADQPARLGHFGSVGAQIETLGHGLRLPVDGPVANLVETLLEQPHLKGAIIDHLAGLLGDQRAQGVQVHLGGDEGTAGGHQRLQLGHTLHQQPTGAAAAHEDGGGDDDAPRQPAKGYQHDEQAAVTG